MPPGVLRRRSSGATSPPYHPRCRHQGEKRAPNTPRRWTSENTLPHTSVNKPKGDSESSFCARQDPGEPECCTLKPVPAARKGGNGMGEASPSAGVQAKVSLREVSAHTVRDICDLCVAPGQERFVALSLEVVRPQASGRSTESGYSQTSCNPYHGQGQPVALLPNLQLPEVPHNHVDRTICSNCLAEA